MENASKALIMAAGVLIGILILSLAVYLFVSFGTTSKELHKEIDEQRIQQFNNQFTSYEKKDDITIHDVITVANLATENNSYYELTSSDEGNNSNYIVVLLKNKDYTSNNYKPIQGDYNEIAENRKKLHEMYSLIIKSEKLETKIVNGEEIRTLPHYECNVELSDITKRVKKVVFTQKNV